MKNKLIRLLVTALFLSTSLFFYSPKAVFAKDNCEISYTTKNKWSSGFEGEIQITNSGSAPIEYWNIQFDLDKEIQGIWGAKIVSHINNHYVISYENWNSIIQSGQKTSIGFSAKSESNYSEPSNIVLTDIIDDLNKQDEEWQKYTQKIDSESIQKSFAEFFVNYYTRFESTNPHQLGYQLIEKNPVNNFTNSKYENVTFDTDDGLKLKGLFFPVNNPKGTVVVLHGRETNMYWTINNIQFLIDNGYQVLLYNARVWNYYKNPESFTTNNVSYDVQDANCAAKYLKTRNDVDSTKIGIYGFSYGANKAIDAGDLYKDFKLVIEDGASSVPFFKENDGIFSKLLPPNWFDIRDGIIDLYCKKLNTTREAMKTYDYDVRMKELKKPVLLLHGMQDQYVSVEEAKKYYDEASGPKEMYTFQNSGHCNAVFTQDKNDYEIKVLNFLDKYMK